MSETGQGAGERPAGVTPKRRGATVSGGAKRRGAKTTRLQLHLGETTARRLAVHAALAGRNQSRVADEILSSYLDRYGKGKELFSGDGDLSDQGEADAPTG